MFEEFINKLSLLLKEPLPGEEAQLIMGSGIRMEELRFMIMDETTKKSGVLILLYPNKNTIYSSLILRPKYNGTHSGQVALPGGKFEKTDTDITYTALRETFEEIGVDSNSVNVIGQLTKLFIPPSNYVVFPIVGFVKEKPVFIPDKDEVVRVIEYPITALLDKKNIRTKKFKVRDDITFTAPYFSIRRNIVWGATAMILSEFSEILKETGI